MSVPIYTDSLTTPVGGIILGVNGDGALVFLSFHDQENLASSAGLNAVLQPDAVRTAAARGQLEAYLAGTRQNFDLPLAPRIGTAFQQRVWQALTRIPHGVTWSYARLAAETGSVARAVGSANGANPIALVVPCHRVIGADGSLTGYAGGLDRKRWLLRHEGALLT